MCLKMAAILDLRKPDLFNFLTISDKYPIYFVIKWPPVDILEVQKIVLFAFSNKYYGKIIIKTCHYTIRAIENLTV